MSESNSTKFDQATLGGGCFWCLDAGYRQVRGVSAVVSGYAGGQLPNPTYEAVSSGATGHAEVVQITFDPAVVSYADLLDVFWTIHNPTTLNRQGHDVGSQYRSIILYNSDAQQATAEASLAAAQKLWDEPIVTEIKPLDVFYPAEDYHQDYFNKNPAAAYCQAIINPKLKHLRETRSKLLI
jgi:peptide-methionine (S)-S-oxide reductase